jgi:hypothetical protein
MELIPGNKDFLANMAVAWLPSDSPVERESRGLWSVSLLFELGNPVCPVPDTSVARV